MSSHKIVPHSVLANYVKWKQYRDNSELEKVKAFFAEDPGTEVYIIPEAQTFEETTVRQIALKGIEEMIVELEARMICAESREAELLIREAHQKAQEFTKGAYSGIVESAIHG